jgi:hypothetical protein
MDLVLIFLMIMMDGLCLWQCHPKHSDHVGTIIRRLRKTVGKYYQVVFIGDIFYLSTNVHTENVLDENEDIVIAKAHRQIEEYYGWSMMDAATLDIEVTEI